MRIAFVTAAMIRHGREDDQDVARRLGARFEVWNDPDVDWALYDRVVIRSPWDYTFHLDAFLAWCDLIGSRRLRNPPGLVAFNADKRYLDALDAPSVPTTFVAPGDELPSLRGEVVIKPNVSAGARNTGRFGPSDHSAARALISDITAQGRTALVQPFLPGIEQHGETALVYLGGRLSHTLHKRAVLTRPGIAPLADGEQRPGGGDARA